MTLFNEIATLFTSAPTSEQVLDFQPSRESRDRTRELLELAQANQLDAESRIELVQIENLELLMRMTKARIRARQTGDAQQI